MPDLRIPAEWARKTQEFLQNKRRRRMLLAVVVAASVVVSVEAVRRQWQELQQEEERMHLRQWEHLREPAPELDPAVLERNTAWDQIMRKQRDPDYEIPESQRELIRKHWDELTADMSAAETESLRQMLDF